MNQMAEEKRTEVLSISRPEASAIAENVNAYRAKEELRWIIDDMNRQVEKMQELFPNLLNGEQIIAMKVKVKDAKERQKELEAAYEAFNSKLENMMIEVKGGCY